jgi:hypothetical protein
MRAAGFGNRWLWKPLTLKPLVLNAAADARRITGKLVFHPSFAENFPRVPARWSDSTGKLREALRFAILILFFRR